MTSVIHFCAIGDNFLVAQSMKKKCFSPLSPQFSKGVTIGVQMWEYNFSKSGVIGFLRNFQKRTLSNKHQ